MRRGRARRRAITRSATMERRSRSCSSTCFSRRYQKAPRQIVLDLDATDDPLDGDQEGGFFHGYYDCCCHLPLYVFCGRRLLAAKLRRSNIDGSAGAVEEMDRNVAQIRERWPKVKIVPARRFRLCARGLDGVVRGQRGRLRFRSRPQWTAGGAHRRRVGRGAAPVAGERRPAGAGVSRLRLVDQGQLVAPAAGDRQGRMDRRRSQPALYRDLAQSRRLARQTALRKTLLRPRRDGEPDQGM